MFDHVSIGVRDLARAKRFYDAVLAPLGYACLSEDAGALGYGRDKIALWIGTAARPVPPDPDSNLADRVETPLFGGDGSAEGVSGLAIWFVRGSSMP